MKNNAMSTNAIAILCLPFLLFLLILLFPTVAYANSSWHWLTNTNPFDVLPFAAILTLLIEYIAIKKANAISRSWRLFVIISIANIASFLLPFAVLLLPSEIGYSFEMSIQHLPKYIVGIGYLLLTLIVEMPVVYISYQKIVSNKKRLIISIIMVNAATTIMVAAVERIICRGSW